MNKVGLLTFGGRTVRVIFEDADEARKLRRYKIHVGDKVSLNKWFPSVKQGLDGLQNAGVKKLRMAGSKADRCYSFTVTDAHLDARNSLYVLESVDGEFAGAWPSYALTPVSVD